MHPAEHFVVALVPVVAYVLARERRVPHWQLIGVVFVGSLFPDLLDKPLAYELSLIPTGRVFMHSLPFALPLLVIVGVYGRKTGRFRLSIVFGFAYLSHLVGDNVTEVLGSETQLPTDLLWPFLSPVARPAIPYWAGSNQIVIHLWSIFSVLVLAILTYFVVTDLRAQHVI